MNIRIISVGKLPTDLANLANKYTNMCGWPMQAIELKASKLTGNQAITQEAKLISAKFNDNNYTIALDVTGKQLDSMAFHKILSQTLPLYPSVDFIIGGAYGLDSTITKQADLRLSLSMMTLPHGIVKVLLLEQIYRAFSININHPYHK